MRLFISKRKAIAVVLFCFASACRTVPTPTNDGVRPTPSSATPEAPFKVSVVPTASTSESRFVTIALEKPHEFYVVLTNISKDPQAVWETSNSWGAKTISFEFKFGNNPPVLVTRGPEGFTKNNPSTFLIPAGEHRVYPIRLDKWWDTKAIPKSQEMLVSLKAIYQVSYSPEASDYHVWTGRVESSNYQFTLSQW